MKIKIMLPKKFVFYFILSGLFFVKNVFSAESFANYPQRAVRFIVPFVPGAGTDLTTRAISKKLTEQYGQQFIPDNRSGAAGAIGADITAKANPDGYTLCLISSGHTVLSASQANLPYDLLRDLQAVTQISSLFYLLVINPQLPAKSLKELIVFAKNNPGKLTQGSSGTGALQHLSGEMLAYRAGVKFTHVPYKGGAASLAAVIAGEVDLSFTSLLSARAHIPMGRIRVLGITASKRSPVVPDIPTIAESGVLGFEANQWYGVITSAKVPMPIVNKLSAMIQGAVHSTDVVERLVYDGSIPVHSSSAEFKIHLATEISKWRKLIKEAGLNLN
jgi:hypothetical protein